MTHVALHCGHCKNEVASVRAILEKIPLAKGGFHLRASCGRCGSFLKFLPHTEPRFFWGKFSGRTIKAVAETDRRYLIFLLGRPWLRPSLRRRIEEVLNGNAG